LVRSFQFEVPCLKAYRALPAEWWLSTGQLRTYRGSECLLDGGRSQQPDSPILYGQQTKEMRTMVRKLRARCPRRILSLTIRF
jgi:hypothetical protein